MFLPPPPDGRGSDNAGRGMAMGREDTERGPAWDPWAAIPAEYNLGAALTAGQVRHGHGDRPALLWEDATGRRASFTYAQLDALSSRFASALAGLGVGRGDRVFLRLPNRPEFYVAALGAAKLGAVFIPTSPQFREGEVRYRLRDSEAAVAVTTTRLLSAVERARADCPLLREVVVVDDGEGPAGRETLAYTDLIARGQEAFRPAPTRNDDLAFLAYTSGTTGDPKGVVHLQRYPIAYEALVRYWHDYQPDDVVACPSELGWLLPVASTFLYALARGLTVVLYDPQGGRFDPERWFELFPKYRITNFTAPPTVYRMLMAAGDAARHYDLSSWRHAVSAGEPLPADTLAGVHRHFGVTHPGMMKEYWNKPERTAEIFRGPWYYSGDVLARDADGYFWFKGRNDDVIKASGYRISPFEVESCLVSHPAVAEAAAVAGHEPDRG